MAGELALMVGKGKGSAKRDRHLDINGSRRHDASVRTTLTLDDDVADSLKERARLLDRPFKQVVNDTLRRGMAPAVRETEEPRYRVVPNRSGLAPGIDPLRLNHLNDQLAAEEFAGQHAG